MLEIPLTVGVDGSVVAQTLAAVGAVAAFLTSCKIIVEKRSKKQAQHQPSPSTGCFTGAMARMWLLAWYTRVKDIGGAK